MPLVVKRLRSGSEPLEDGERIPLPLIAAYLLLIVVAGWLVTVPLEWSLASRVIAWLYGGYIGVSVILLGFWSRGEGE